MTPNPLLADNDRPFFSAIRPEHAGPAVDAAIAVHRAAMAAIVAEAAPDFERVFLAKERADARLWRGWSAVSHLNAVCDTPELRAVYQAVQPRLSAYAAEVGQDAGLYAALAALEEGAEAPGAAERRALDLTLRDFRLSGVALAEPARSRFAAISVELSELSTQFSTAVLDATASWTRTVTDPAELAGLPEADLAMLAAAGREAGAEGWLVTLHAPSVSAVLTHADNRALREEVYRAFGTRASDSGPDAGRFDNGPRIARIMALRAEAAALLGYENPVALSLATKMARDATEIEAFLTDLAARARPFAETELADLRALGAARGIETVMPWDIGYLAEKLRRARHSLDEAEVRRYFPEDRVIDGLFRQVEALYDARFVAEPGVDAWHPDVRYYRLERDGAPIAGLYVDLHARKGKRGGAWMNVCRPRLRDADRQHLPIAHLVCNFAGATGDEPALLRHDDVVTLFHEMGHCLHHMLSSVEIPSIAGVTGFEWDAVELPSQLMENFAWDPAVLTAMSRHVETGEPLPADLIARMLAARNFMGAMALLRQAEFALFDLRLHLAGDGEPAAVAAVLQAVRDQVAVVRPPEWHRFPSSFSHVFAGGYAAGYYSYLWAERLSADAFERFVAGAAEAPATIGRAFRDQVLAVGATRPAIDSVVAFLGREPTTDALLRARGLAA